MSAFGGKAHIIHHFKGVPTSATRPAGQDPGARLSSGTSHSKALFAPWSQCKGTAQAPAPKIIKPKREKGAAVTQVRPSAQQTSRPQSKQARVIAILRAPNGAHRSADARNGMATSFRPWVPRRGDPQEAWPQPCVHGGKQWSLISDCGLHGCADRTRERDTMKRSRSAVHRATKPTLEDEIVHLRDLIW